MFKKQIDGLSQYAMCYAHRFHKPCQDPWFDTRHPELVEYWQKRFREVGGMTPEISKHLGWER